MMKRPFHNTLRDTKPKPLKDAMPILYHADGTGRDTYCISNSGGLTHDYGKSLPKDSYFRSTLRYQPKSVLPGASVRESSNGLDLTDYQSWPTP